MKQWLFLPLLAVLLCGCQKQSVPAPAKPEQTEVSSGMQTPLFPEGKELFSLAESEEEAERIAALYGVELVDFSFGVAVFHTEEDPIAVVRRGAGQDWPPMSVNRIETLTDPVTEEAPDVSR